MSVIMRFGRQKAILTGSRWTAANRNLESKLNDSTARWLRETGGPPIGDADPDFTTALAIGAANGGRLYRHLLDGRASSRSDYFKARQMDMF